ncbi:MAG: hypothetical protein KDC71_01615 [Acidobacteria bacterium]|nr:hypothetical protein [Acidobacteriota bacterium]
MSTPQPSRRMALIAAMVALSLGTWLFLEARGIQVPALGLIWPIFIGLGALASFLDYFLTKTASSAGKGVFGLVLCATGFLLTQGYFDWRAPLTWLPALPFGAGLGMLLTYFLKDESGHRLLIRGVVFTLLGLFGWLPQFPQIQAMMPNYQTLWAAAFLVIGSVLLISQLRK